MIEISRVAESDTVQFSEAMEIYQSSFPPEERHSVESINERVKSGREELYCLTKNCETLGIALIWNLKFENYSVLDYFAIRDDSRCMGHGGAFLSELLMMYEELNRTLIIEVEEYRNSEDTVKIARASFYKSLGFLEIRDFRYVMPSIEGQPPVNMVLMLSGNYRNKVIERDKLSEILTSIYGELYYVRREAEFTISQLGSLNRQFYALY